MRVEQYLAQFDTTFADPAARLRWVEEHRSDWERMVTDGIAWLIASDEYAEQLKTTTTTTED